jgi:hypothetical protein
MVLLTTSFDTNVVKGRIFCVGDRGWFYPSEGEWMIKVMQLRLELY